MIDSGRYDTGLSRWMDDAFGREAGIVLIAGVLVAYLLLRWVLRQGERRMKAMDDGDDD